MLEILGHIANAFGLFGSAFSALAWLKLKKIDRLDQPVSIFLSLTSGEVSERKIELPLQMRRRDLTRAEILGRLGMIPMREKGKRFSLAFLAKPEFITALNAVADRKTDTLEIPCTKEEIEQFDL